MSGNTARRRRLALALIRIATGLLPPARAEWASAMRAEFHYLNRDIEALAWAIGCIAASISMRIESMITGNLKISRWVLAPELLLCFAPLTFAWYDGIFGTSGIIRLNPDIVQRYFLNSTTGAIVLVSMFALTFLGLSGPLGLLSAIRVLAPGKRTSDRRLLIALVTGPVLLGVIYFAGWLLTDTAIRFDHWAGLILCSLLPALGAAHMLQFSLSNQGERAPGAVSPR